MPDGRTLTAAIDKNGHLTAIYCVDVFCKTSITSTIYSLNGCTDPSLELDPQQPNNPIIAFHHLDRNRISFARCNSIMCTEALWIRDVAFTIPQTRFQGGVSLGIDKEGEISLLYR